MCHDQVAFFADGFLQHRFRHIQGAKNAFHLIAGIYLYFTEKREPTP